jgi:hypothetical protein
MKFNCNSYPMYTAFMVTVNISRVSDAKFAVFEELTFHLAGS